MRITKALLHKLANDTIKQRKRSEPDLHAAYLMGSLLGDDPLLGGSTDIDLVLVHRYLAPVERETTALTPEVSLDILHTTTADYEPPRQFRKNALMGYPLINSNIILFDTDHWLEFLQSSVTAEFHRTDNVLARVNALLSSGREIWQNLYATPPAEHLNWLDNFLQALAFGANALAGLIGPPLTTRRFMPDFNQRMHTLGTPDIYPVFCGLLGCMEEHENKFSVWIDAFEKDLELFAGTGSPPPHLSACRQAYYVQGIKALAYDDNPTHMVWPLLRTWLDLHIASPQETPGFDIWQDLLNSHNFTEEVCDAKVRGLDAFLDRIEILIETWSNTYAF